MEGNGATQTKKAGTYEVRGAQFLLKNPDGTIYQNWQAELSDDGQSLTVHDEKLFETFQKTSNGTSETSR